MKEKADYAVIVALDEEAKYVVQAVGCGEPQPIHGGGVYWRITGPRWKRFGHGVLLSAGTMGRSHAKTAAQVAIKNFDIDFLANVGIAGRVDKSRQLGDVIVPSVSWDLTEGGKIEGTGSEIRFAHAPRSFLVPGKLAQIAHTFLKQGSAYCEFINARLARRFGDRQLLPHGGISVSGQPIACVPNVGAHDFYRDSISNIDRNIGAMEMESAGIIEAATEAQVNLICVKGISDHAGFDKGNQEAYFKDENRRLAMEAALCVLEVTLIIFSDEQEKHDSTGVFVVDQPAFAQSTTGNPGREALFSSLVRTPTGDLVDNPIREIANVLRDEQYTSAFTLIGDKGSGKTTLFRDLQCLLARPSNSDDPPNFDQPAAILLRLSELEDWSEGSFDVEGTRLRVARACDRVTRILRANRPTYLLLDGLNETGGIRGNIAAEVLQRVLAFSNVRLAISAESPEDIVRLEGDVPELKVQPYFRLEPMDIDDPRLSQLVDRFSEQFAIQNPTHKMHPKSIDVISYMRKMDVRFVDVYLLHLFFERASDIANNKIENLTQLYEALCERALAIEGRSKKEERKRLLSKVAACAFDILVTGEIKIAEVKEQNVARLISTHASVPYFLVATHLVEFMLSADRTRSNAKITRKLDYVLPAEVNSHTKQMMSSDPLLEDAIVRFIRLRHDKLGVLAKSQLAYLAGRVSQEKKHEMLELLKEMGAQFRNRNTVIDRDLRMLRRTIYISRALLGDGEAEEQYVDLLLSDNEEAEFNRGFHLVYWGDERFQASGKMANRDYGTGPCNRTFSRLLDRLVARTKGPGAKFPQIELLTLLSLVQIRLYRGVLREEQRSAVLSLIRGKLLSHRPLPPKVKGYVDRIAEDLDLNCPFNIATVMQEWSDLANIERTGWRRRRRDALGEESAFWASERIESVAEHTYGAIALAEVFLTARPIGGERYQKARVIDLLRVHDLAESRLGDQINGEASAKAESSVLWQYGAFATYPGVGDLWSIPERFNEFVECRTLEARIAQDLDRLHFVLRARAYRKGMSETELEKCEQSRRKIMTETVRGIDEMLSTYPAIKRYATPEPRF